MARSLKSTITYQVILNTFRHTHLSINMCFISSLWPSSLIHGNSTLHWKTPSCFPSFHISTVLFAVSVFQWLVVRVCEHQCVALILRPVHWKVKEKGSLHLCLSKQKLLSRVEDSLRFSLWNWISASLGSFDFATASYQHALTSPLLQTRDG